MQLYQKLDGSVLYSGRDYPIDPATKIHAGQVVKLSGGKVVAAGAAETGAVLGVAAESHSGSADAFDPNADGEKIKVFDDPAAVYQCAAPKITAFCGSPTTLVFTAGQYFAAGDFTGGYVKLVSTAEGSTNTDEVGTIRPITEYTVTSSTSGTFTLPSGGTPNADDVYAVFPPVGFAKGNLNAERDGIVLTASAALSLRVIGSDMTLNKINVMAKKHIFAVSA